VVGTPSTPPDGEKRQKSEAGAFSRNCKKTSEALKLVEKMYVAERGGKEMKYHSLTGDACPCEKMKKWGTVKAATSAGKKRKNDLFHHLN